MLQTALENKPIEGEGVPIYFSIREKLRSNPWLSAAVYLSQNLGYSFTGRLVGDLGRYRAAQSQPSGVALCMRFRNEARFLDEWLEYHSAAGVDHFFLYNNFSEDKFLPVIEPWLAAGRLTLVDWPKIPASPGAEEDCIRRAMGRFAWVGFIDADEFIVVEDGRSIGEFLLPFRRSPGVVLHWKFFGSSGWRDRPALPVIAAYQHRAPLPNRHIKSFVQPHCVTQCRNPHAWFYRRCGLAVTERGAPVFGSLSNHPSANSAWINHYYCKSEEDYREKMAIRLTHDRTTMRFPTRTAEKLAKAMVIDNEVLDASAEAYYRHRCQVTDRPPRLLEEPSVPKPQ